MMKMTDSAYTSFNTVNPDGSGHGGSVFAATSVLLFDGTNREVMRFSVGDAITALSAHESDKAKIKALVGALRQLIGHWDAAIACEGTEFSNGAFDSVKDTLEDARDLAEGEK